ncbi:MAG TPA: glycosyltransferase family 39 protein [Verrucomicrobiae bacterium]|nr:glycosyltransferase family 39 protein [Verrucomicrobiae bacterium]
MQTSYEIESKGHVGVIIVLMLFVAGFSLLFLSQQSLRLDEAQSLWQVSNSIPRMINIIAQDVHVPFYHVLLHLWLFYLGDTVFMARMFSLIFAVLTVPLVYVLGRKAFNPTTALFATILTAISPFLIWYGNEVRMYSLLTFLTVINQIFFVNIFKTGRVSSWVGYAVTAVLALFTHYYFGLLLISQLLFFLYFRHSFPYKSGRRFLMVYGLILAIFTPWLYYVYTISTTNYSQPLLTKPTVINLFITFSQFVFGFQTESFNRLAIALWPLAVLFGFLALSRRQKYTFEGTYFFYVTVVPVVIAFIASLLIRPLYLTRYLILIIPTLYLFMGWLFSSYPLRLERMLKGTIVAIMMLTLVHQSISASTPVKENFREAADYLSEKAEPQDLILVSAPFTIYPIEYYYEGPARITTMPEWDRFVVGPIPAFSEDYMAGKVETYKATHQRIWVLLSYDQGYEEQIRLYFDKNFERLDQKNFSTGLNLYAYKLRYN